MKFVHEVLLAPSMCLEHVEDLEPVKKLLKQTKIFTIFNYYSLTSKNNI